MSTIAALDPAAVARSAPTHSNRAELIRAVASGGLVSGVLDATDAVVAFGLLGMNPVQVLQFVASGAFGPAAFEGGLLTASAGAGFHFVIAFVAAAVYAGAARSLPALRRNWIVAGLLYGAWVWVFMNLIVLPFTSVVPGPTGLAMTLNGVVGHALFVGLPIAFFARFQNPGVKLRVGDTFPIENLTTVRELSVRPGDSRLLHIQFRRWVGCPICNTHVGQLIRRADDIEAAGVREVLVFHSSAEDIRTFRDDVPFDLVADPTKELYAAVGAETSFWFWLSPKTLMAAVRGILRRQVSIPLRNGPTGLPAEFLIDATGRIVATKYGTTAYDQWTVDELLSLATTPTISR